MGKERGRKSYVSERGKKTAENTVTNAQFKNQDRGRARGRGQVRKGLGAERVIILEPED